MAGFEAPNDILALALLSISFPAKGEDKQVERVEIKFQNARWQALPDEVQGVNVGPDGRMWFETKPKNSRFIGGELDKLSSYIPAFKDRIAQEFSQPSPQYYGATLALFEPSGRVWFFLPQHCLLLGYDGKTWIEYVFPDFHERLIGCCPTRGSCVAGGSNRFVQGTAWFVCTQSILRYDGKNWSKHSVAEGSTDDSGNALLSVSPDGQTAAACKSAHPPIGYSAKGNGLLGQ